MVLFEASFLLPEKQHQSSPPFQSTRIWGYQLQATPPTHTHTTFSLHLVKNLRSLRTFNKTALLLTWHGGKGELYHSPVCDCWADTQNTHSLTSFPAQLVISQAISSSTWHQPAPRFSVTLTHLHRHLVYLVMPRWHLSQSCLKKDAFNRGQKGWDINILKCMKKENQSNYNATSSFSNRANRFCFKTFRLTIGVKS